MDDAKQNLPLEIDFIADNPRDANNDPWIPAPHKQELEEDIIRLPAPPNDPLKEIISSDKYLDSLEKKLSRIQGKQTNDVKASEIIQTLQSDKDDRLAHFLTEVTQATDCDGEDQDFNVTTLFSLQRKIHPEKQALNPLELLPLIQNDILAKVIAKEEENECQETVSVDSKEVTTSCS